MHDVMRQRRNELGLSQADLAAQVGTDGRQIRRYEAGETQPTLPVAKEDLIVPLILDRGEDVPARASPPPVRAVGAGHVSAELGSDDGVPPPAAQRDPEQLLGRAFGAAVGVGGIEERDACFKRGVHYLLNAIRVDPEARTGLEADLQALLDEFNVAKDGTLVVPSEYLEVVITKKS